MNTLLYLKWITNKGLLYSTWNSAQYYVAAWIGGEFGGKWIYIPLEITWTEGHGGLLYMYGWVPSLFTWNNHNTVNQLHSNTKFKSLKRNKLTILENKKNMGFISTVIEVIDEFWTVIWDMVRLIFGNFTLTAVKKNALRICTCQTWSSEKPTCYRKSRRWIKKCKCKFKCVAQLTRKKQKSPKLIKVICWNQTGRQTLQPEVPWD